MDLVKVDPDVAYVTMVVYVCCKRLFLMFYLFFRRMLQVFYLDLQMFSDICCKYFIRMLHMFAMDLKCFQVFS
jgi:hypothetical protein